MSYPRASVSAVGDRRVRIGAQGESAALSVYEGAGYRLVARNWRRRVGEIDLIVCRDGLVVFCEVKTRSSGAFGAGFDAVTREKQHRIRRLAELFLIEHRSFGVTVRFDVASVSSEGRGRLNVNLFEDAF